MAKFTAEQIQRLKQNPYTCYVSENRIIYSLEFKEFVLREAEKGNTSVKIFEKAGYDIDIFGRQRIYGYIKYIKREAASPEGLKAPRLPKEVRDFATKELEKEKASTAIKDLQNQLIYMQQEIEFLKKISAIQRKHQEDE